MGKEINAGKHQETDNTCVRKTVLVYMCPGPILNLPTPLKLDKDNKLSLFYMRHYTVPITAYTKIN